MVSVRKRPVLSFSVQTEHRKENVTTKPAEIFDSVDFAAFAEKFVSAFEDKRRALLSTSQPWLTCSLFRSFTFIYFIMLSFHYNASVLFTIAVSFSSLLVALHSRFTVSPCLIHFCPTVDLQTIQLFLF